MRTPIITVLTLCTCFLWLPATVFAESPPKPPCICDDDCAAYGWAGAHCVVYGSGYGYCSWSGQGTPCKEAGVPETGPRPPETGPRPPETGPRPPEIGPRPPEIGPRPPETGPRPPEIGPRPPEQGPGLEPGYPESDPWYEDMKAVSPKSDAGPSYPDGGEESGLTHRGGCSIHGAHGSPWLLTLLLLGALFRFRRP